MYTTAYTGIANIERPKQAYVGGVCKWWFVPIEDILTFPPVNPANQQLNGEPVLKPSKKWYGPVLVPEQKTGWEQSTQISTAGISFTQKVAGFLPGNSAGMHINIGNLVYHQVCIVARLRAGGLYVVLGNKYTGLNLLPTVQTGIGSKDTPGINLQFTGEQAENAQIIPAFTPDQKRRRGRVLIGSRLLLINNQILTIR